MNHHQPIILQSQQNFIDYNNQMPKFIRPTNNRNNRFNFNNNNNNNNNNQKVNKNNKKNFRNNDLNDQQQTVSNSVNNNNNTTTPKVVNKINLDNINKKRNYEFNENEFPSLNNNSEETVTVLSENQKKLIKNVNFLKQQVELYYKNDIEERENKSTKLSFKEALEKPKDSVIKENDSKVVRSRASSNDLLPVKDKVEEVKIKTKTKKRSRKKKTKDSEEKIERNQVVNTQEFKLNDDDFPGLNGDINSRSGYSSSSKNVINKLNSFSLFYIY